MPRQETFDPADRDVPDRGFSPSDPKGGAGLAAIAIAATLAVVVLAASPSAPLPTLPTLPSPASFIAAPAPAPFDPSRFILNALLVPALDGDAVPLRWVDPRPRSFCGPATEVRVNQAPLVAGALVPAAPFEIEWRADGCRSFGTGGPRFDGSVRLVVFREDWGLSAIVEPRGLRIAFGGHETTLTRPIGAWLPFVADAFEPVELNSIGAGD